LRKIPVTGYGASCSYGWNKELSEMEGKGKGKVIAAQALKDP
jgi:hypothetical protein